MSFQEKLLGQARPNAAATDVSVVWCSDGSGTTEIIKSMVICCQSVDTGYYLFLDNDGTDCTASTALAFDAAIGAWCRDEWNGFYPIDGTAGGVWFQINDASAATISAWGAELIP